MFMYISIMHVHVCVCLLLGQPSRQEKVSNGKSSLSYAAALSKRQTQG